MAIKIKMRGDHADVLLYDVIGKSWDGGIGAKEFRDEIQRVKDYKTIDIRINSSGGDVFEGIAIFNVIRDLGDKVTIRVDAIAASIASYIAMAADRRVMAENAWLMIHNPYTIAIGDARAMRKIADDLDAFRETLIDAYHLRTNIASSEIEGMMDNETWINAKDGVANGWVTHVEESQQIAACVNTPIAWKRSPFAPRDSEPVEPTVKVVRDRRAELAAYLRGCGA